MKHDGYVLIVSPDEKVSPGIMSYEDFVHLWEDAHKQNPKRWNEPPPHSPEDKEETAP